MQAPLTKSPTTPQVFVGSGLLGVEVLVGLGLSGRQARVYLALLRCGGGRVKEVAECSLVHRQEVYRLLDCLLELGLVRRNISVPVSYSATPIAEVVELLLKQKSGQISLIRQQAQGLIQRYSQLQPFQSAALVKACFGSVYEADRGKRYLNAIKNSQTTIEAVLSWRRFKQICIHYEPHLQNDLKKGVTIRIITEKPPNHRLPKWINTAIANYPHFEVKTTTNPPIAGVAIFDQTQVAIAHNPNSSLTKGPDLWTIHPALVIQAQTYVNAIWKQTKTESAAAIKSCFEQ